MRTQVAIIGSGPAGLLLGEHLTQAGIDNVILEKQSQAYVAGRIRAGVLEDGTVAQLRSLGLADRLDREGLVHDGLEVAFDGARHRIDIAALTGGRQVTVYGQTEVTRDLMDARQASGAISIYEAADVLPKDFDGARPSVSFRRDGAEETLACDFIVGADGYHGVSRASAPERALKTFERDFPYAWLGLLADVPPVADELIYVNHADGFALCSMRSPTRSRYYLQCPPGEDVAQWNEDRFFDALRRRLDPEAADNVTTGPALEMSVAPIRCFVAEPLRFGAMFLAGDAGHIVPPTGAKGLNLAASDVRYLAEALIEYYQESASHGLDAYSGRALARVWASVRFSLYMTDLTHRRPDASELDLRLQAADLRNLAQSKLAQAALADRYAGAPY